MKVVWSRVARDDLDRIQSYLEIRSPRAARRMWKRILVRVDKLKKMPFAAPFDTNGVSRRLVISQTPYLVFYRVVDDEVRVDAVFHAAQNR